MAPPVTPSPHRFLGPTSASRSTYKPATDNDSLYQVDSDNALNSNNQLHIPKTSSSSSSSSSQRSSQFAAAPRFALQAAHPRQSQQSPSPRGKRDHVEDIVQHSSRDVVCNAAASPGSDVTQHRARRERIVDDLDDGSDEEVNPARLTKYTALVEADYQQPSSKRRKLPLPPVWSGSPAVSSREVALSRPGAGHPQPDTSPRRTPRSNPIIISSSPPSTEGDVLPVSPAPVSPASPTSIRRSAPRFDFSRSHAASNSGTQRQVTNASSALQRVLGTSNQFILPTEGTYRSEGQESDYNLSNANLALLFSPQKNKRYQYAPGGMAATVRDWVLGAAVDINGIGVVARFRVVHVGSEERGSRLVVGRDEKGEESSYLLVGEQQGVTRVEVAKGMCVTVMEPSWVVEMDGSVRVAVKWKIDGV